MGNKIHKILMLIPPYFSIELLAEIDKNLVPSFTTPYGVLSIEAYVSQYSTVKPVFFILDLNVILLSEHNKESDIVEICANKIKETLDQYQPDLVGISALFNTSFKYLEVFASAVKKVKNILVVAGGGLPSAGYKHILEMCPSIDAVCYGEGEIPMLQLIDAEDPYHVIGNHDSWIDRSRLEFVNWKPSHSFVQDLDLIPVFNYNLVDLRHYNSRGFDKRYASGNKIEIGIHTSRGCPFKCVFCASYKIHGHQVRTMSVQRVFDEVKRMHDDFGMNTLMIDDDHFLHDKNRAIEILLKLSELQIRIEFPNGVAVYAVDEKVAEAMSMAGVSSVALAVESGSEYVLKKIINKPMKKSSVKPAIDALHKYNIMAHVFIVIGLPGETDEHRDETHELLLNNDFDWAHISCAIPIFGSKLHEICLENNYFLDNTSSNFITTKSVIKAPGVDPDHIADVAYKMNLSINFVNNSNARSGRTEIARMYFQNVVNKYPSHAFAHYFLSKVSGGVDDALSTKEYGKYIELINKNASWMSYAKEFGLPIEKEC